MLTSCLKKSRASKIITSFVLVNFILSGISFKSYALANADKLRPNAAVVQSKSVEVVANAPFLGIVPQNIHEGKGSLDVGAGLTIRQLVALKGLTSAFVGHTATRERYITEARGKLEAMRSFSRFDEIINGRIKVLRGLVASSQFEKENLDPEIILPKLVEEGYITKDLRVNSEFIELDNDFKSLLQSSPFSYTDKQIKQIEAILQQALSTKKKIKEIHLGVGSVRKNVELKAEIEDIEKQLDIDLKDITLADLQEVNFNISYEPSIDIKLLKDEQLKDMVRQAHQFIYDWFVRNYGEDAIDSVWGRTLKVLFRGSVIKDKNKDNVTPIMAVKIKSKKNEEIPGVHGVVFATSGKEVEGCLEVAKVVNDAAMRDSLQYVVMVNLKSIEDNDKDRTSPEEYVNQIYAALADGRLDRAFIIPEIAAPDVELKEWLALVAKAEAPAVVTEGSTLGEMKWEMVKQSALYSNNNLALTGIEVRNSFLSTGHPTVEVGFNLISRGGRQIRITGEAASGASAGNREALFLFDKDFAKKAEKQSDMLTDAMIVDIYGKGVDRKEALRRLKSNYEGKGVEITLWIARNVLIPELTKAIKEGKVDPKQRYSVDHFMREYEKTHGGNERQKLILTGGNTTAFSTAAAKLGAAFNNMETYEFLSYRPDPKSLKIDYNSFEVVIPIAVLIEGGEHGNWNTDFQEYMVEVKGKDFEEISLKLINITFALDKIMQKRGDKIGVGLEAGYLPNVMSNTEPIEMIVQAGRDAGYNPGKDFAIALDVASSEFRKEYQGEKYYFYSVEGKRDEQVILSGGEKIGKIVEIQEEGQEKKKFLLLTSQEQLKWALDICKNPKYFIASVEDFFDQDDLWGNMMLTRALQDKDFIASLPHEFQRKDGIRQDAISHVGDDISTSNMEVVRAGIDGGKVIFEGKEGKEELVLEKDTIDAVLLKLNQAGTVQEIMELVEYLRSRGRTIAHSHRGKEPSKETIRADVALASTTYPSREHDRTGAPAKVKIKYGSIRKERAVVYDYLRNAYMQIEKKAQELNKLAKYPGYLSYIQTENTVYSASGGSSFDKLVAEALANARKMSKNPVLKVSVGRKSDNMAQVVWEFAGKMIRKNLSFKGNAALIVNDFNEKFAPVFEQNKFNLTKEADFQEALGLLNNWLEVSTTTNISLKDELLTQIREAFLASKGTQKIDGKSYVFLVTPDVLAKGGMKNILAKAAELDEIANIKFAFYGDNARELKDILEIAEENIITAGDLTGLLKELANRNIDLADVVALITQEEQLNEDGEALTQAKIRQIVAPDITTLGAAKAIKELLGSFDFVKPAFNNFMEGILIENKVIEPINSLEHEKIIGELKEGVFFFPVNLQPIQEVSKVIEEAINDEQYKKFVAKYL